MCRLAPPVNVVPVKQRFGKVVAQGPRGEGLQSVLRLTQSLLPHWPLMRRRLHQLLSPLMHLMHLLSPNLLRHLLQQLPLLLLEPLPLRQHMCQLGQKLLLSYQQLVTPMLQVPQLLPHLQLPPIMLQLLPHCLLMLKLLPNHLLMLQLLPHLLQLVVLAVAMQQQLPHLLLTLLLPQPVMTITA